MNQTSGLQSYEQLVDSQNNRKQKKFIPFSGYISLNQSSQLPIDPARSQHKLQSADL